MATYMARMGMITKVSFLDIWYLESTIKKIDGAFFIDFLSGTTA